MATKFPKFSQGLAQDPTTRRIWFGIATSHDFESHDGMTELRIAKIHVYSFYTINFAGFILIDRIIFIN